MGVYWQMVVLPILFIVVYLLPWIVAMIRNTKNRSWVAIVTIFFGWTILGWFVAFLMAAEGDKRNGKRNYGGIGDDPGF